MAPSTRDAKQHAKARRCRYRKAHERLARDRRQAQHTAKVLEQALEDVGLSGDLVGVIFPPLFGCRTNTELCRVRGWDKSLPSRLLGALPKHSCLP